jgi:hypothetical protein
MNPLENRLHSWKPRHPSAGLERALFGPAPAPPCVARRPARWRTGDPATWLRLAPVLGCLVLSLTVLRYTLPPQEAQVAVATAAGTNVLAAGILSVPAQTNLLPLFPPLVEDRSNVRPSALRHNVWFTNVSLRLP